MSTSTAPMNTMEAHPLELKELAPLGGGLTSGERPSTAASHSIPLTSILRVPDTIESDISSDSNTIVEDTAAPPGRAFAVGPTPKPARVRTVHFEDPYFSEPSRPNTPTPEPHPVGLDVPFKSPPHASFSPLIPQPPPLIITPPRGPPPPPPESGLENDAIDSMPIDSIQPSDIVTAIMKTPVPAFLPPPPPLPPPPDSAPEPATGPVTRNDVPPPPPPGPPPPLDITYTRVISSGDTDLPRVNTAAQKIYEQFMTRLKTFVQMQEEVTSLRVATQEKRAELGIRRNDVSDKDRLFMDALRASWITQTTRQDPDLEKLYEQTQASRNVVGPLEAEYEEMENKLGSSEFRLKEQYEELQRKFNHFFKLQTGNTTIQSRFSDISYESASSGRGANLREERNIAAPLNGYAMFGENVKVGEIPQPIAIPQAPESQNTTSNPQESSAIPSAIPEAQFRSTTIATADDADVPKGQSSDRYVPLEDPTPDLKISDIWPLAYKIPDDMRGTDELTTVNDEASALSRDKDLWGDGRDLLLLGEDDSTQSTLSDYLHTFTSTKDRINMWLLHKLRISPWEMYELERSVQSEYEERIPSWAQMALETWKTDKATDYRHGPESIEQDSVEQPPDVLRTIPLEHWLEEARRISRPPTEPQTAARLWTALG